MPGHTNSYIVQGLIIFTSHPAVHTQHCDNNSINHNPATYIGLKLFVGPFFSCKCLETGGTVFGPTTQGMQKCYF